MNVRSIVPMPREKLALAAIYFRMNPRPIFRRGTPVPPSDPLWPINHFSLIALLVADDLGGRTPVSICSTRIILPPRLISFEGLGSLSCILVFLTTIFRSTDKGGVGGRTTGSIASNSAGSRSGKGSFVFFAVLGCRRTLTASA